jgi:hypothetical protein
MVRRWQEPQQGRQTARPLLPALLADHGKRVRLTLESQPHPFGMIFLLLPVLDAWAAPVAWIGALGVARASGVAGGLGTLGSLRAGNPGG